MEETGVVNKWVNVNSVLKSTNEYPSSFPLSQSPRAYLSLTLFVFQSIHIQTSSMKSRACSTTPYFTPVLYTTCHLLIPKSWKWSWYFTIHKRTRAVSSIKHLKSILGKQDHHFTYRRTAVIKTLAMQNRKYKLWRGSQGCCTRSGRKHGIA